MKVEEIIVLLVPLAFILMLLVERIRPARRFPQVPHWHSIGMMLFLYAGVMNSTLPLLLPEQWLRSHRLFDLAETGLLTSVLVGHLLITFVTYWWHRAAHSWAPLWRGFHQMHHAPRHLNIYAANWVHPADLAMYILLPAVCALFVLGVDPLAAIILGNLGAFNAFFQHWNVRTPHWLGYFLQRPEAHCVHHQRGHHRDNYSDLPLWDMVFGTFRNPVSWQGETGFDAPADRRYGAMLAFVDVNATVPGDAARGISSGFANCEDSLAPHHGKQDTG